MKKKTNRSFEKIFEDLEKIVKKMELGDVELEESLELFEKGMSLVDDGKKKLAKAELKIKNLTNDSTSN
ncbi:MAG: exodeoxyribonuclease VII small subunit [Candidatus Neomarinimicrobiota bacterium]|tara:strand:- start:657 stop:863 length:207 start_codon:yes stop_codon:yes gene_type:complete